MATLRERVDEYFRKSGRRTDGGKRLLFKTICVFAWLVAAYVLLVFCASNWWLTGLLAVALGLAVAGVGFNVQHDGGHDAFAPRRWGNRVAAYALDLVGGSSYIWRFKHATIHHSFTNVEGVDDDIDAAPFLRLSPGQKRRFYHRGQHWYAWVLFGFLLPKWEFLDDFRTLIQGRVGTRPIPRPGGLDLTLLLLGKIAFVAWVFAIPLLVGHSIGSVLIVYAISAFVCGVCLSLVFQLAHCVEEASFPALATNGRLDQDRPWAEHQLATTVDFAPRNRLLCWYLGGLNFQVEHHLMPKVSHVHYPAIAPIVRDTCAEFGVPYLSHRGIFPALASHVRHLRRLGRADQPAGTR
jgi:linoleoyl-CoA desaturase